MFKRPVRYLSLLCLSLLLNGACTFKPYRFELQQGTIIPETKVAQIKPGMTQEQVRFILGTPTLQDVFHMNRWDYLYYLDPQDEATYQKHLVVYFDHGVVAHIATLDRAESLAQTPQKVSEQAASSTV